jgi:hypothetical protein
MHALNGGRHMKRPPVQIYIPIIADFWSNPIGARNSTIAHRQQERLAIENIMAELHDAGARSRFL